MKIRYRQTCRVCGIPMEPGTTVGRDAMGMFHAKGCEPAKYEPVGTKRRPGDGGKRPTNAPRTVLEAAGDLDWELRAERKAAARRKMNGRPEL